MLTYKARGPWYHVEGKNSMGVKVPRHSVHIAVYDRFGKIDKATKKAVETLVLEMEKYTEWPPKEAAKEDLGLTLEEAYTKWLAQYKEESPTWKAYKSVDRILVQPLALKGITLVKQVTGESLKDLQKSWLDDEQTLNTIQTWRKFTSCLFNYCVNFHELPKNPWKPVKALKEIKPSREQIMAGQRMDKGIATLPLDPDGGDANWRKIQEAVPAFVQNLLPGQIQYRSNPMFQFAATFLTFLWLLYETGLRRGDALIFRPDRIVDTEHGGAYTTAQIKTGGDVTVFLPKPLVEALRALPCLPWRGINSTPGAGLFPFYDGSRNSSEEYMEGNLNGPLRDLGKLLFGEGSPSLRPHRFRDSFAVNMLQLGLSLQDVQHMLGHKSLSTTEKYYKPYVLGMQKAVERRQAAARQAAHFAEAQAAKPVHHPALYGDQPGASVN